MKQGGREGGREGLPALAIKPFYSPSEPRVMGTGMARCAAEAGRTESREAPKAAGICQMFREAGRAAWPNEAHFSPSEGETFA